MAGVLVTRPEADAAELAEALRRRGHTPLIEPLLDIRFTGTEPLDLTGVQALVFTSANGVRAAAGRTHIRDLPVHAVGRKTADAARQAGFVHVTAAAGDGQALAADLTRMIDPAKGRLLHVGGAAVAVDIGALLRPHGINLTRVVGYEAVAAGTLSAASLDALDQGLIGYAMFFSPRTARTFASLLTSHGRQAACARITALCLSAAVAAGLDGLRFQEVRTADRMEAEAMLELLPG